MADWIFLAGVEEQGLVGLRDRIAAAEVPSEGAALENKIAVVVAHSVGLRCRHVPSRRMSRTFKVGVSSKVVDVPRDGLAPISTSS